MTEKIWKIFLKNCTSTQLLFSNNFELVFIVQYTFSVKIFYAVFKWHVLKKYYIHNMSWLRDIHYKEVNQQFIKQYCHLLPFSVLGKMYLQACDADKNSTKMYK
jgi:hypothetical protein